MTTRRKRRLQIWIEPELDDAIQDVVARYRANGRPAKKTEIIERLLRDGFRFWAREDQVSNRIEAALAQVIDHAVMTRAMQNAALYNDLDGDEEAYQRALAQVEQMKAQIHVAE